MLISSEATNFNSNLTNIYDPNAVTTVQPQEQGYINGEDIEIPDSGTQYGHISCERIGLDAPVYWFDSEEILEYGAGQSLMSMPPGFDEPVILSGHANTFFSCFEYIEPGDVIKFGTFYANYEYTVTHIEIMGELELEDLLGYKIGQGEELIMYTCYPLHATASRKTERMVVFADRTSGPDVKWRYFDE